LNDLFEVYNRHAARLGLTMEIYHSSIVDWIIKIEQKETRFRKGSIIVNIQHSDYQYALAKAQVELKEWLLENDGGY
jgi:hypothetical protein